MMLPLSVISYGPLVTSWCYLEYPNHPDGCPNYLDKFWCPPKVQVFPEMVNIDRYQLIQGHNDEMFLLRLKPCEDPSMWLFVKRFDLGAWVKKFLEKNPTRSDAQARIPYLWHSRIYKTLYAEAEGFRWTLGEPSVLITRPEANGVNLFATCRVNGGPQLKKNPRDIVYFLAMVGLK